LPHPNKKKQKKIKLVASYKKNFDKTKKFVRQKIGTNKFGSSQKIYYKN
jgi:hypothetical protein